MHSLWIRFPSRIFMLWLICLHNKWHCSITAMQMQVKCSRCRAWYFSLALNHPAHCVCVSHIKTISLNVVIWLWPVLKMSRPLGSLSVFMCYTKALLRALKNHSVHTLLCLPKDSVRTDLFHSLTLFKLFLVQTHVLCHKTCLRKLCFKAS